MPYSFDRYLNIRSAQGPVFSPNGQRIAFLSDVTGNFQAWSVGLAGETGECWPRQLTYFADKVWELHGTPAFDHLIAVSDSGGNERQQFYLIANYGVDGQGFEQHDIQRLTTDDDAIHRFGAWSSDGLYADAFRFRHRTDRSAKQDWRNSSVAGWPIHFGECHPEWVCADGCWPSIDQRRVSMCRISEISHS